ncbi:MAG TPA: SUMF1/EgtB/PvdO family nonheme iron enzyme [Candidatus Acidoferrales bacterium]|nr:SUMF1/EgtB/PvdO family nonheme iron enzyme [Candidatus Acidoferrales bacterium]
MKISRYSLCLGLTLFAGVALAAGQEARFFRISGPAATTTTAFNSDGTLVWSNALAATNYVVQAVCSLPAGSNWVDYVRIPATPGLNTNLLVAFNPPSGMSLIPAGSFMMGDTVGDSDVTDAPPTSVTVSAFYLDVNLVSWSQWQSVYSYATNEQYSFANAGAGKATNQPVQTVDWYDVVKWCNARSQQAGLSPVYFTDAALTQLYTNGDNGTTVYANWTNSGFRLPTEAEWEKAARGGLNGQRFPWGNTISESQANYFGDPQVDSYDLGPYGFNVLFATGATPYTSPVGYFAPNGYGLYDMAGNVFEWCWDWYGTSLGQPTTTNPTGAGSGIYRVFRGGNWRFAAGNARCFGRSANYPDATGSFGFRCARGL